MSDSTTQAGAQATTQATDGRLLAAAVAVQEAATALGEAYRELEATLRVYRREAWEQAGELGQQDINPNAGQERAAEEVAGTLVAVGLGDVLEMARRYDVHPVTDFPDRWARRVECGQLRTSRRR